MSLTNGLKRIFGPARCARWPRPFSLGVRRRCLCSKSRKDSRNLSMKRVFTTASRGAYKLGAVAAIVHLVVSWWIIGSVLTSPRDTQWQLIWIFLLPFDVPFSLLVLFAGYIFRSGIFESFLRRGMTLRFFVLPTIVHGIIGPVRYFLLPVLIDGFMTRRALRSVS